MSVSDHIQMLKSKETPYEPLFEKLDWLYVNDTQQTYNTATSIIETASLSNSNKFCMYNKAYLSVPLLVTVTQSSDKDILTNVNIKQSFLSMINSITVDLNGTNVVQQYQLIDILNNFHLVTRESDVTKPRWSTIGFQE